MATKTYEISDEKWERIRDMLPLERTGRPGRPCKTTNRQVLNGTLWIDRTGAQWKELPSAYGKKSTVHERFKAWKDSGVLEAIFAELSKDPDMQDLSFDSTSCKVHQHAGGTAGNSGHELNLINMRFVSLRVTFTDYIINEKEVYHEKLQ